MPGLSVTSKSLVPRTKPFPADASGAAKQLENSGNAVLAEAVRHIQNSLNDLHSVIRNASSEVTKIAVTDAAGKVVAYIGDFEFNGVVTRNYFSEIHIGDPLGTGDPTQAIINVNANGQITIGSTGWVDVLDPYGADAAWIGTQFDVLDVTGAVASATTPLIRLTVPGHGFLTGDAVIVQSVGGVPNATGTYNVTVIDATHVDLQASVFVGTYTSGGTITRLLHVTGAVNNGAGLIRLTVTAHGYESGDKVNVVAVGGVPNASGQWIITVIDASHFDLRASTWAGAYTSGGTCIRYFAGGNFQTIAVGGSTFANYKLRAFPDGTLKIKDAEIILHGSGADIDIDPTTGQITVTAAGGGTRVTIGGPSSSVGIVVDDSTGTPASTTTVGVGTVELNTNGLNDYLTLFTAGEGLILSASTAATQKLADIYGYTGATGNGPLVSLTQLRGTGQTPAATQSGDTIGGIVAYGYDGAFEPDYAAGVRAVATEAHAGGHGAKLVFEVTPNAANSTANPMTLDQDGKLNVAAAYKVAGTQVVTSRQAAVATVTATAGATYTATEQAMLASLKTAVNALIARLQAHGLTS